LRRAAKADVGPVAMLRDGHGFDEAYATAR
jgi:hypothetical protein